MAVIQTISRDRVVLIDDDAVRFFQLHDGKVYQVGNKSNTTDTPRPDNSTLIGECLEPASLNNRSLATSARDLLGCIRRERKRYMDKVRLQQEREARNNKSPNPAAA